MSKPTQPPNTRSVRFSLESLEDRTTPTFLSRPAGQPLFVNNAAPPTGGLSIAAGDLLPDLTAPSGTAINEYVTGTGPGTEGLVRVWRLNGTLNGQGIPALTLRPFPGFAGGINVAVGDVTGDGDPEIIAAVAANGPPHVKVFNASGQELGSFFAFDPGFLGGVNIAVGNVLGGIALGGYPGGTVSSVFKQEIIIGAAAGGTPHVVVTNAAGTVFRSFLAFDAGYKGGVTVAAADIDTDFADSTFTSTGGADENAYDEIVVGAATAVPHVKAFDVYTGAISERLSYFAYDPAVQQGVTVAAGNTTGNRGATIYVSQIVPENSLAAPTIRAFDGLGQFQIEVTPFPATYSRVVNMSVAYVTPASRGPGFYDPSDNDSSFFGSNSDFLAQDLFAVAGDGPYFQIPRFYIGLGLGSPAGTYGPPP